MCPRCGLGFISKEGVANVCSHCSFTWPGELTDEMLDALKYAILSNGSYRHDNPSCALMNELKENDASIGVQAGTARVKMEVIVDDFCRIGVSAAVGQPPGGD